MNSPSTLESKKSLLLIELRKKDRAQKLHQLRTKRQDRLSKLVDNSEKAMNQLIVELCSDQCNDEKTLRTCTLLLKRYLDDMIAKNQESCQLSDAINTDVFINKLVDLAAGFSGCEHVYDILASLSFLVDLNISRYTQERLASFILSGGEESSLLNQKRLIINNIRLACPKFDESLIQHGFISYCAKMIASPANVNIIPGILEIAMGIFETVDYSIAQNNDDVYFHFMNNNNIEEFGIQLKQCVNNGYEYTYSIDGIVWLSAHGLIPNPTEFFDYSFIVKLVNVFSKCDAEDAMASHLASLMYTILNLSQFEIESFHTLCGPSVLPKLRESLIRGNIRLKAYSLLILQKLVASCSEFTLTDLTTEAMVTAVYVCGYKTPELHARVLAYICALITKCSSSYLRMFNLNDLLDYLLYIIRTWNSMTRYEVIYHMVDLLAELFDKFREASYDLSILSFTEFHRLFSDKELPCHLEELALKLEKHAADRIEDFLELYF